MFDSFYWKCRTICLLNMDCFDGPFWRWTVLVHITQGRLLLCHIEHLEWWKTRSYIFWFLFVNWLVTSDKKISKAGTFLYVFVDLLELDLLLCFISLPASVIFTGADILNLCSDCSEKNFVTMADKTTVQEEIKKQGEIVRKLKEEKADKDLVGLRNARECLVLMTKFYQYLTFRTMLSVEDITVFKNFCKVQDTK